MIVNKQHRPFVRVAVMVSVLDDRFVQPHPSAPGHRCRGQGMPIKLRSVTTPRMKPKFQFSTLCPGVSSGVRALRLCLSASHDTEGSTLDIQAAREQFTRLMSEWEQLATIMTRFGDFDVEGKRRSAAKIEDICERIHKFSTQVSRRKAVLMELHSELDAMGWAPETLTYFVFRMQVTVQSGRYAADIEEQLAGDPTKRAEFRAAWTTSSKNLLEHISSLKRPSSDLIKNGEETQDLRNVLVDPEVMRFFQQWMQAPDEATRLRVVSANPAVADIVMKFTNEILPESWAQP